MPKPLLKSMPKQAKNRSKNEKNIDESVEYKKREGSVKYLIKDGFFTSMKAGFTESFIMPFAIALNASAGMLAILGSVPQLVASFFQLFGQESLKLFKTRSRIIFWSAFIQAFFWLPILLIPFIAKEQLWLLLLLVTLEATIGTFQAPIYNSILGDLIPDDKRGEFFGNRNRMINLVSFVATFIAGFIINAFQKIDQGKGQYVFIGFAILFFIAFVSRIIAAMYKRKIYDPKFTPTENNTSLFKFFKNMTKNNYGIFVMYILLFKFSAAIAMPFFALYLLRDLHMSYMYFTIISAVSILASFVAMSFWGRMIDKHGSKKVLTISGFLVPLSPLLMILAIFINNPFIVFIYLVIEEIFSGVAWSAFNLSTSSFLFDATTKEERIKHLAYYNFLVGIGVFLGAMLGGVLIGIFPVWVTSSIPLILLVSGILRFISTFSLIKKVREARMVEIDFPGRGFFHSAISIHPRFGSTIDIIDVYHEPKHKSFHTILPVKKKTVDPVGKDERSLYEKKSLEYYRENAMKTLRQNEKDYGKADDSDKFEADIAKHQKDISEITEEIKKKNAK